MGDEDFDAYTHEDDASEELGLEATGDGASEVASQVEAEQGEEERHDADYPQRQSELGEGIVPCTGKGDADGEGIDACGNGQQQLRAQQRGIEVLLLIVVEALLDHLSTNEGEQREGDPVVYGFQILAEIAGAEPAQQGHHGLEESEEEGHAQINQGDRSMISPVKSITRLVPLIYDSADDGYREAVHRQGYR